MAAGPYAASLVALVVGVLLPAALLAVDLIRPADGGGGREPDG
jgi:hypothetical protein